MLPFNFVKHWGSKKLLWDLFRGCNTTWEKYYLHALPLITHHFWPSGKSGDWWCRIHQVPSTGGSLECCVKSQLAVFLPLSLQIGSVGTILCLFSGWMRPGCPHDFSGHSWNKSFWIPHPPTPTWCGTEAMFYQGKLQLAYISFPDASFPTYFFLWLTISRVTVGF